MTRLSTRHDNAKNACQRVAPAPPRGRGKAASSRTQIRASTETPPSQKSKSLKTQSTKGSSASGLSRNTPARSLPKQRASKLAQVTAMLRKEKGASLEDLMRATGWQAHSVRGALSGSLKKRLGLAVRSALVNGERRYRIEA